MSGRGDWSTPTRQAPAVNDTRVEPVADARSLRADADFLADSRPLEAARLREAAALLEESDELRRRAAGLLSGGQA